MIEEPYRWLEAISNRREYVREQIKEGSPVFAVSLPDGILLLGVGSGQSKVFELFDRHALAGLGHPADIEKIRQTAIDTAHMEAFARAPEDVSLRRLISFGLSTQLKTNFEQVFSAPFLVELILAELGHEPDQDYLVRLQFDGVYRIQHGGVLVAANQPDPEAEAHSWLKDLLQENPDRAVMAEHLLQAWWCLVNHKPFGEELPSEEERKDGWRKAVESRTVEIGWLNRHSARRVHYETLTLKQLGL